MSIGWSISLPGWWDDDPTDRFDAFDGLAAPGQQAQDFGFGFVARGAR